MWELGWSCRLPFAAWLQPGLAPPGLPNRFPTLHSKYPQFGTTLNILIFKRFKFHNLRGLTIKSFLSHFLDKLLVDYLKKKGTKQDV